jgi:cytoskeletal protein CcmA (bactofilin family)
MGGRFLFNRAALEKYVNNKYKSTFAETEDGAADDEMLLRAVWRIAGAVLMKNSQHNPETGKMTNEKGIAFLGKDARLEGVLKFSDTFRIDGHFKGEIIGKGTLVVGDKGFVESNIKVSAAVIYGEVCGDIKATEKIELHLPGKVLGDLESPSLVIDEGVVFEGSCRIRGVSETVEELEPVDPEPDAAIDSVWEPAAALGTVFGLVTDTDSGQPIEGADVKGKCKGVGKRKTKTDASGCYELTGLEDGEWKIEMKAKGYEKITTNIVIFGGGRYEQNFT